MFESVSILLPTLNETFSFIQTVKIIVEECDKADICEIIAIICPKTTKESVSSIHEAQKMAADNGVLLRIIDQTIPYAGGAVRDGMSAATGSHTLMMAPDLETDPHTVKKMIEKSKAYPEDMITASRWLNNDSFKNYNPIKYVCNYLFQHIFSFLYGVNLTDLTYGYRLAPSSLFKAIQWEEEGHPFFLETALKPIRLGITIHEIPSKWEKRLEGESTNGFFRTFKYLRIAIKVRFEDKGKLLK